MLHVGFLWLWRLGGGALLAAVLALLIAVASLVAKHRP